MNIQADLPRPIKDELHDKHHKCQVESVTQQPQGFTATIETVSQSNHTLKNLPDLLIKYYRQRLSVNFLELDMVKQFPVKICWLLSVLVVNFQDAQEVTWHWFRCRGTRLWMATGQSRNEWLWVDSGNINIHGALKDFYLARLVSIMKVGDQRIGLVYRLVLANRLYVESSGKISDIRELVTFTFGTAKGPKGTTEIVVSIKRIMDIAHLVPETAGRDNNPWYVNNMTDLKRFNRIY